MSRIRLRAVALIAALPLVITMVAGAAMAEPPPQPGGKHLPEGPWPPGRILAGDPSTVVSPLAATTTNACPPAPYGVQSRAPGAGRTVALTFDDGPGPSTNALINVLARYGVPATFFNLGVNSAYRPREVRGEASMGWLLGNHTWDHPEMPYLPYSAQASEMDRATSEQSALTGLPSCVFRPPYGEYDSDTLSAAYARHMSVWTWSVDTEDWKADVASSYWVNRIISLAEAGSSQTHPVILMHNAADGNPATVAALPTIIQYYRNLGYTFVDLVGHSAYTVPAPAVSRTGSGMHLFTRGADSAVYERTRATTTWGPSVYLAGLIYDGVGAVATSATETTVVVQGLDNELFARSVNDSGTAGPWTPLGGIITSRPTAAYSPDGSVLTVVARGADQAMWVRERRAGVWGPWTWLQGIISTAPAAAWSAGNTLTVAALGRDNAVWLRRRVGGTWSWWETIAGTTFTADPALVATTDRARVMVVARGADYALHYNLATSGSTGWTGWHSMAGILYSGVSAIADGTTLRVFAYGRDYRVWEAVGNSGTAPTAWVWAPAA